MAKKKDAAEILADNVCRDPGFQKKWRGYLARFGADIDILFSDSFKAKIRMASVLQKICDGNYEEAEQYLKSYVSSCSVPEEKDVLNRLIAECEKNILPEVYPQRSERYRRYRDKLLSAGFSEAKQRYGHFFRPATEKTALIINLYDEKYGVSVLYGITSTVFMAGDEEWLANNGSDDTSCQVRNLLFLYSDDSENEAAETISAFYALHKNASKDEVLVLKKERQKSFLDRFTVALQPLDFKKKGTRWTKDLQNGSSLSFEAQKSAFSDEYYFNVNIHDTRNVYLQQSFERVTMNGSQLYNWQLMTEEQIGNLIDYVLTNYIQPKMSISVESILDKKRIRS